MSCNGCRVLRKGCSESCILRPCLQWIESQEAQGHATVFVAKFFGRAGLMSFISAVPENQRPALFQSLLFEACGRTVNPVNGAVGLLWTGNWHVCQEAVETVLRGGALRIMTDLSSGQQPPIPISDENYSDQSPNSISRFTNSRSNVSIKRSRRTGDSPNLLQQEQTTDLDLRLTPSFSPKFSPRKQQQQDKDVRRPGTPSMNSEESVTTTITTCFDSNGSGYQYFNNGGDRKLFQFL